MTTTTTRTAAERRKVAAATMIGTTVEWYDFFIYSNAAALVLGPAFFKPVGGTLATLISYATVGISFLFRPLGAVVMGRIGDRHGRRIVLLVTLLLMGLGTTLVGLLPTYDSIGLWAPILLIFLRIVQGFSAGGEWGGAALLAVEHAPNKKRGFFGAFPQLGVPAGMLLASGATSLLTWKLTDGQFTSWGWRVPFLLSFVLIIIGHVIRQKVAESPVFEQIQEAKESESAPLTTLFREYPGRAIQATLVFMGNNCAGYMLTGGFVLGYATNKLGLHTSTMLDIITVGSAVWLVSSWASGWISDYIGRRRTFVIGWVLMLAWIYPLFLLIDTARVGLVFLSLIVFAAIEGITAGPLPALYAEIFPARIRFSGSSISYAMGAVLGGAFAPTIAEALVGHFGSTVAVSTYLFVVVAISLIATLKIGRAHV